MGKKSRKEAKRTQERILKMQEQQLIDNRNRVNTFNQASAERNRGITQIRDRSKSFLDRFESGEDIATLIPQQTALTAGVADRIDKTFKVANRLGNNAFTKGDKDFQAKLSSLSQRQIARAMAVINSQALQGEVDKNRGLLFDSTNFLNADARAGLGLDAGLFNATNSLFSAASQKRQMEMSRTSGILGMAGVISDLVTGGVAGATGLSKLFRRGK